VAFIPCLSAVFLATLLDAQDDERRPFSHIQEKASTRRRWTWRRGFASD